MVDLNVHVPAIEKLLDYTASGVGSIAGPMLAPWIAGREAKAGRIAAQGEADARRIVAQAEADALSVLAAGQAGALPIIAAAREEARRLAAPDTTIHSEMTMVGALEQVVRFQDEKRLRNIGAIVSQAADAIADEHVTDHEPDHDWAARFFGGAQDVSSKDMQQLWARVLAGETRQQGSTSIRTLDILRNIDRESAVVFVNLCSVCVSLPINSSQTLDIRAPSLGQHPGGNSLRKYGLNFENLNLLNEHGLIIADYNSRYDYSICAGIYHAGPTIFRIPFRHQEKFWILRRATRSPDAGSPSSSSVEVEGVALTRSGKELSRVVDIETKHDFAQELKRYFVRRGLEMIETTTPHWMQQ